METALSFETKRIVQLQETQEKIIDTINDEIEKNNTFSAETKKKIQELSEETKKKKYSFFSNASFSFFRNDMTGLNLD